MKKILIMAAMVLVASSASISAKCSQGKCRYGCITMGYNGDSGKSEDRSACSCLTTKHSSEPGGAMQGMRVIIKCMNDQDWNSKGETIKKARAGDQAALNELIP